MAVCLFCLRLCSLFPQLPHGHISASVTSRVSRTVVARWLLVVQCLLLDTGASGPSHILTVCVHKPSSVAISPAVSSGVRSRATTEHLDDAGDTSPTHPWWPWRKVCPLSLPWNITQNVQSSSSLPQNLPGQLGHLYFTQHCPLVSLGKFIHPQGPCQDVKP